MAGKLGEKRAPSEWPGLRYPPYVLRDRGVAYHPLELAEPLVPGVRDA